MNRRDILRAGIGATALSGMAILKSVRASELDNGSQDTIKAADSTKAMTIHYLEIVTKDVDAMCALYSQIYGVTFGDADDSLGGARTTKLAGGGMLGIRAPLRPTELPVVRPYILVEDIAAAVAAAGKSGAEIAMEPTEIAGYGQFAIVIQGGIENGLWQL